MKQKLQKWIYTDRNVGMKLKRMRSEDVKDRGVFLVAHHGGNGASVPHASLVANSNLAHLLAGREGVIDCELDW